MTNLDLEGLITIRRRMGEQCLKRRVIQMKIQTAGKGAHPVARGPQHPVQRQPRLFRRQIPQSHLQSLMKRQRSTALIAAARATAAVHQAQGRLAHQTRPNLGPENPRDLGLIRQSRKQRLHKAQTHSTRARYQLQRRHIHIIRPHLTVANHPVACELEPCDAKID